MAGVRNRNGFALRAFTLVELLVVIGIIALLISILLPTLGRARQAALDTVCMSDFRQWGIGLQIYCDQNKGQMPQKGPDGSTTSGSNFFGDPTSGVVGYDDPSLWFNAIPPLVNGKSYYQLLLLDYQKKDAAPHEGQHNIFMCPLQQMPVAPPAPSGAQNPIQDNYYQLYGLDSGNTIRNSTGMFALRQFKFNLSYVMNSKLTAFIGEPSASTADQEQAQEAIKMSALRPTSEIIIMTEKIGNYGEYKDATVQKWNVANPSVYLNSGKIDANGAEENIAQSKADWTRFTARHHGGGYLLYADGHVSYCSWPDAQYDQSQLPLRANSDANRPGKHRWSAVGPVNSG